MSKIEEVEISEELISPIKVETGGVLRLLIKMQRTPVGEIQRNICGDQVSIQEIRNYIAEELGLEIYKRLLSQRFSRKINLSSTLLWYSHPMRFIAEVKRQYLGLIDLEDCSDLAEIGKKIVQELEDKILEKLFWGEIEGGDIHLRPFSLKEIGKTSANKGLPKIVPPFLLSVIVYSRGSNEDLETCLDSLRQCDLKELEIIVVGDKPPAASTKELIASYRARYIQEKKVGLGFAWNSAIREAKGDIISFIDETSIVDKQWTNTILSIFASPEVMGVVGLMRPYTFETSLHSVLEARWGDRTTEFEKMVYNKIFYRIWHHTYPFSAWLLGVGPNVAYRKEVFYRIGYFDGYLDAGCSRGSSGMIDFFCRALDHNMMLIYHPSVLVKFKYPKEKKEIKRLIYCFWKLFYCLRAKHFFNNRALRYKITARSIANLFGLGKELTKSLLRRGSFSPYLVSLQLLGVLSGPFSYLKNRRSGIKSLSNKPDFPFTMFHELELTEPIKDIENNGDCVNLRLLVKLKGDPIGMVQINNIGDRLTSTQIKIEIVKQLGREILFQLLSANIIGNPLAFVEDAPLERFFSLKNYRGQRDIVFNTEEKFVSVIVCTKDREEQLKRCLDSLNNLRYENKEIIVVDNASSSGGTKNLVKQYPARYLWEGKKGKGFALNLGIQTAKGEILAFVDDDVVVDKNWLNNLTNDLSYPGVMCATGLTLPLELDTMAANLFEAYYQGFGRGYKRREYGPPFPPSHVGNIGGGGNAAFKKEIFDLVGYFDEILSPGTPGSAGEDTDLFYRIVASGYKIRYNPSAVAWHIHRTEYSDLSQQIFKYGIGSGVCFLKWILKYRDLEALKTFLSWQFRERPKKVIKYLFFPLGPHYFDLALREFIGGLVGPFYYPLSKRYVMKQKKIGAKKVLLTFDDGPDPVITPKVLEVLKRHEIKAIFFALGEQVTSPQGTEIIKKIWNEGHLIGNHSYSHPDFRTLSEAQIRTEILKTEALLNGFNNYSKLFRPPYGWINKGTEEVAREEGYHMVFWDVDPRDWSPEYQKDNKWVLEATKKIKSFRKDLCLVLLHDIHESTVIHLEELIHQIEGLKGVTFCDPSYLEEHLNSKNTQEVKTK
jgi:peptidoglycan/xylan/chitin deacetylase (PgdA/CDA1 family)